MTKKQTKPNIVPRPPIVVIMGHIDHGKSTLLDYIRKTNIVEGEVGGITQHLSAYVAEHKTKDGETKKITFLDTPGHASFQKMRFRGADVADIAILIVSAEDGVMPQTLEALECIKKAGIPYIVAINKIDKPGADLSRTQSSLIENEIYIEGMGGEIPWGAISAKKGDGVDELLDVLLLAAELHEFTGDENAPGSGNIIEAHIDSKRGNTATLIIKDGQLEIGDYVVSQSSCAPVRIMEDFSGTSIKEAKLSEPVQIIGWNNVPNVGAPFLTVGSKKEAEKIAHEYKRTVDTPKKSFESDLPTIPLLIKADVSGTIDAILHELEKFSSDRVHVRIIDSGVGDINASDIQSVSASKNAIVVGFNVKVERPAKELAERLGVEIETFSIIYELSKWLEDALKNRTPKIEEEKHTGRAKVLKAFSTHKDLHVLGGRAEDGILNAGQTVNILRRDIKVGTGIIKNLQQAKSNTSSVSEGEFGMQIQSKAEIAPGDYLDAFEIVVT